MTLVKPAYLVSGVEAIMRGLPCRLLVFGTALLLACPPGWCCALPVASPTPKVQTKSPPSAEHSCCCPRAPGTSQHSLPAKTPPIPGRTCCCHLDRTLMPGPESVA